jgi:hypothetical protein
MKKKLIIIAATAGAIGAAAFGYWTISPLFIDVRVSEEMPAAAPEAAELPAEMQPPTPQAPRVETPTPPPSPPSPKVLGQGEFIGVSGHSASGLAKIIEISGKRFVRFEDNFQITNGPDLFVYLGKDGAYDPAANLGGLKGNIGSQNYEIPDGINLADYDSIWVWCRAFHVGFGTAELK